MTNRQEVKSMALRQLRTQRMRDNNPTWLAPECEFISTQRTTFLWEPGHYCAVRNLLCDIDRT